MFATIETYAAVVFDFDGTLADSYAAIAASVNHVRSLRGLGELDLETVKRFVGRGAEYLLQHTVPTGDLADNLAAYRVHHPSVMYRLTQLLPGADALVRGLHEKGKKIGLCSNKPRFFSEKILAHFGWASQFAVVLGPDDVPRPKPAPDMLRLAVERLALRAEQVLYIGDMVVDIQTARSAGVCVWAVATGSEVRANLDAAGPDRLLTDLRELVAELPRV